MRLCNKRARESSRVGGIPRFIGIDAKIPSMSRLTRTNNHDHSRAEQQRTSQRTHAFFSILRELTKNIVRDVRTGMRDTSDRMTIIVNILYAHICHRYRRYSVPLLYKVTSLVSLGYLSITERSAAERRYL